MGENSQREICGGESIGQLAAISFRPLHCLDISQIQNLAADSFEKVWSEKDYAYFIAHSQGVCFGAFSDRKLLGYSLGLLIQGDLDIASIAVSRERRRQGLGAELFSRGEKVFGVSRIFLEVEAGNQAAIHFYEKLGMRYYGLRKKYYEGVKDAVLMKKELTGSSSLHK